MVVHRYIFRSYPNDAKSFRSRRYNKKLSSKPFWYRYRSGPVSSPEDLMKNLPKAMSNMLGGAGIGMPSNTPIFKISMNEYQDMQLKVGDKVTIKIKKVNNNTGI